MAVGRSRIDDAYTFCRERIGLIDNSEFRFPLCNEIKYRPGMFPIDELRSQSRFEFSLSQELNRIFSDRGSRRIPDGNAPDRGGLKILNRADRCRESGIGD